MIPLPAAGSTLGRRLRYDFNLLVLALVAATGGTLAFADDWPGKEARAARSSAANSYARGLLFRIEHRGKPASYVFGTLHSNDPRVTRIPRAVATAFESTRRLAPEIFVSGIELPEFFAAAQFDDGRALADFFDPGSLARIAQALGPRLPPPRVFAKLKPWAVLLLLAQPHADDPAPTLDQALVDAAHARGMLILGLELLQEQVSSLDAIPMESQVALVQWTLKQYASLAADHERATAAWLARDLKELARLADAPGRVDPALAPHLQALNKHLIAHRSLLMAHRLHLPLRDGRVFVAVGALHLYGPEGLLALIARQGYRVTRVY